MSGIKPALGIVMNKCNLCEDVKKYKIVIRLG